MVGRRVVGELVKYLARRVMVAWCLRAGFVVRLPAYLPTNQLFYRCLLSDLDCLCGNKVRPGSPVEHKFNTRPCRQAFCQIAYEVDII